MPYKITVKPGHPKGQFRRDRQVFYADHPTVVETLSEGLQREQRLAGTWLVIEKITKAQAEKLATAPPPEAVGTPILAAVDLSMQTTEQLADLAHQLGIDTSGKPSRADLIAYLENARNKDT